MDVIEKLPPQPLEPFGYYGADVASRIRGLGGNRPAHDPKYAFCTPYVETARGRVSFTARFEGLQAKRGTLTVYVHMQSADGKSAAQLVTSDRIALSRLAIDGATLSISFEGFRNMTFCLLGHIVDDTDASAEGLFITLDNPPHPHDATGALEEAHGTVFRSDVVRPSAFLLDLEMPDFADPVSQACTVRQFASPAFSQWADELGDTGRSSTALWEDAFVLQAAHRYGALATGARALGLGVTDSAVANAMCSRGLAVAVTTEIAGSSREAPFAEAVEEYAVDPLAIPAELVNFDLLWSKGGVETLPGFKARIEWLTSTLRRVRPGSLAIYIMPLLRKGTEPPEGAPSGLAHDEIERLALSIVSYGHEVARLKFAKAAPTPKDGPFGDAVTPFAVIVRRSTSFQ